MDLNMPFGPATRLLRFPHCLFFLELLQSPSFRESIAHPEAKYVFSISFDPTPRWEHLLHMKKETINQAKVESAGNSLKIRSITEAKYVCS